MTDYDNSGQERTDAEPTTDERRAEWERFSMTVLGGDGGGYVNVRNDSHDNPGDHIYSVHVEDGSADGCSCPHAVHRDAHCKHQVAVEQRPLVLASASATASAATTGTQVATDGGTVVETDEDDETADESEDENDESPSANFADHPFSEGDHVTVDWSEGQGPWDEITGIVENIGISAGEIVVGVTDYDDDVFGEEGRKFDCAPEWIEQSDETDSEPDDSDDKRPQTDHWGHEVKHFDDEVVGAGEKRQCQSCGSRFNVAMIAATEDSSNRNWEEFYECQHCGARGSFRFYGERDTREWTGRIAYPDE